MFRHGRTEEQDAGTVRQKGRIPIPAKTGRGKGRNYCPSVASLTNPGSGLACVLAEMNLAEMRFKVLVQCAFMRVGGIAVECFSFEVSTTQETLLWLMRVPARLSGLRACLQERKPRPALRTRMDLPTFGARRLLVRLQYPGRSVLRESPPKADSSQIHAVPVSCG